MKDGNDPESELSTESSTMKVCASCGAPNTTAARFCPECGAPQIIQPEVQVTPVSAPPEHKLPESSNPLSTVGGRRSRSRLIIAACCCAAVALAGVVAALQSNFVKRRTQLPSLLSSVASDLRQHGAVNTKTTTKNFVASARAGEDLDSSTSWSTSLQQTNECEAHYELKADLSSVNFKGIGSASRVMEECNINLKDVNPAAIASQKKLPDSTIPSDNTGFPYWSVVVPMFASATCTQSQKSADELSIAEMNQAGKKWKDDWGTTSKVTLTQVPLLFDDEAAAVRTVQTLQQAAYICGAKNSPSLATQGTAPSQDNVANELVANDSQFAKCQVRELEFHKIRNCNLSAPYCDNMSRNSESHALQLLSDAGYIGGQGHQITTQYSTQTYYWTPNDRGKNAIGNDISEEKAAEWSNGEVAYIWKLNLGCREFEQVDATTQLGDGLKVDFSWHWKVTALGAADGMKADRQRAVAYLKRTPSGLKVDQIQIAHE